MNTIEKYLILPMVFYIFYMWVLALCNFWVRWKAIRSKEVEMKYFKTLQGNALPERVAVFGRHFDNQFQVPLLFLITCAVQLTLKHTNELTIFLAWAFVFTRFVHSWIHLGKNRVQYRALSYAAGWFCINVMWIQICILSFMR